MQNLNLQIHPDFIPMTSRVIILDFRLRMGGFAALCLIEKVMSAED